MAIPTAIHLLAAAVQPSNITCSVDNLGQINGIAGILKLLKHFTMWQTLIAWDKFITPVFTSDTSVYMGIHPHLASQYLDWPSAACGIGMLGVDKILHPRQQTRVTTSIIHRHSPQSLWSYWWNTRNFCEQHFIYSKEKLMPQQLLESLSTELTITLTSI